MSRNAPTIPALMSRALRRWKASQDARDQMVLECLAWGVSQSEISRLTGLSRSTIGTIIRKEQERRWQHLQPGKMQAKVR